jgi:hypothetical protein
MFGDPSGDCRLPAPTPAQVFDALTAVGRPLCLARAQGIAREMAVYGGLDRAAAALSHDAAHASRADLLAYRAALAELADPRLHIARLQREAADLDARAEPSWAEAADLAGRAAFRQLQGEFDLAAQFQRRALAAEQTAAELEAQAFAKRLQAASLQADAGHKTELQAALEAIAA